MLFPLNHSKENGLSCSSILLTSPLFVQPKYVPFFKTIINELTSQIISFSNAAATFRGINCEVVGASIDSVFSHLAWVKTPQKSGGLGGCDITLLADVDKKLSTAYVAPLFYFFVIFIFLSYGALFQDKGFTLRATYIIDDKGVLRHVSMNEPPVGRNVDEYLRLVQAFQQFEKVGEVCPAGWKPGQDTMQADPVKSLSYFEKHGSK